jgi:hypothetical protein
MICIVVFVQMHGGAREHRWRAGDLREVAEQRPADISGQILFPLLYSLISSCSLDCRMPRSLLQISCTILAV